MTATRGCGRFAPSPTGPLHFGSLVTALASRCDAHARGEAWAVRIEDVDEPRTQPGAGDLILDQLARHGFAWPQPVPYQSDRRSVYLEALQRLRDEGHVYECACTRRDLEAMPPAASGERVYPGTCRDGVPASIAHRSARAYRLRVDAAIVRFDDRLQGPQAQDLRAEVGDFVVLRADGLFAYQLAVVVDDADLGITSIVRGADLLTSTPRQIHLQRLLGIPQPDYLHLPVAVTASGEKLSKQTGAPALPSDALATLVAAWAFLEQPPPVHVPETLDEFWTHALAAWNTARLPPVTMLPAPRRFAEP